MTHATAWTDGLERQLARLLSGGEEGLQAGAELEVCHPDGGVALRAPLARHHRVEGPNLMWIRPVAGGHAPEHDEPGQPAYAFDLAAARRRALEFTSARVEGDAIHLELGAGQAAVIRPAAADTLAELQRWDTYYYTALDAETQAELDALAHDP
jgi:hypothetical protein